MLLMQVVQEIFFFAYFIDSILSNNSLQSSLDVASMKASKMLNFLVLKVT